MQRKEMVSKEELQKMIQEMEGRLVMAGNVLPSDDSEKERLKQKRVF